MSVEWNQYLRLPETTLRIKRVPKTALAERVELSKKEQRVLAHLKELSSYAMLGKSNTGILPHIDETYDIRAVLYLDCLLDSWTAANNLIMILHRAFSNRTVLLLRTLSPLEGRKVSVALKRKSLSETSASVVESVDSTDVLDSMDKTTPIFWNMFNYDSLPQNDLLDYVQGMQDVILFHGLYPQLGFSPKPGLIHRKEIRRELVRLKQLDAEIRQLQSRRKSKDTPIGESAELRILESDKKDEAQTIVNHIKELYND